jgi:hypothetical protein
MDQPFPPPPGRRPRRRRRSTSFALLVGFAAFGAAAVAVAAGLPAVWLIQSDASAAGPNRSNPLVFALGPNYASAAAEKVVSLTVVPPNSVAVTGTVSGSNGSLGRYALDVLLVRANVATSSTWRLTLSTTTALTGPGVNAAFAFVCTLAMTGVAPNNPAVSSGTDSHGDPWRIVAPTCAGTERSISLTTASVGIPVSVGALTAGSTVLYVSFALALLDTGPGVGTPGTLTLVASSP